MSAANRYKFKAALLVVTVGTLIFLFASPFLGSKGIDFKEFQGRLYRELPLSSSVEDAENWLTGQDINPLKVSSRTTRGAVAGLKEINAPHYVVYGEIAHSNNSTLGACRMTITLEFDPKGKLRSREVSEQCPIL